MAHKKFNTFNSKLVRVTVDAIAEFRGLTPAELKLKTRSLEEFIGQPVRVMTSGMFTAEDGSPIFFDLHAGEVLGTWGNRFRVEADRQAVLASPALDISKNLPVYRFFAK